MKENYFTTDRDSDKTFCGSACDNIDCTRNDRNTVTRRERQWMSVSLFGPICTSYMESAVAPKWVSSYWCAHCQIHVGEQKCPYCGNIAQESLRKKRT